MSLSDTTYIPRIVDREIATLLKAVGAIVVEGPKACGKTATASQWAKTTIRFDRDSNARQMAEIAPAQLLMGETPVLLDEWQLVPELWNHVRHEVDDRNPAMGQFILTGSSTPDDDARRHSGAGRFVRIQMRPMALCESGESNGSVSLKSLFSGKPVAAKGEDLSLPTLIDCIVRGGWPGLVSSNSNAAIAVNQEYVESIVEVELPRLAGNGRDPVKLRRLLAAIARSVGNQRSISKLAAEAGGADRSLDWETVTRYVDELTRLRVVEDLPAWNTHIRSRSAFVHQPKRMFVDPSLAVAALGASPEKLLGDLEYLGFLFENLVVRDLRVLSQPFGGYVAHARTRDGYEADAIVELRDGRWAAFEVKLGQSWIDSGAESLKRFAAQIDTTRAGEPAALAVIVPDGFAYRRDDGVYVVPLSALGA